MAKLTFDQAIRRPDADLLAVLAAGQNPDGTVHSLQVASSPQAIVDLFESAAAIAVSAQVESAWLDLNALAVKDILIRRRATGGTYALELDWSRDGATNVITETVAVADATSVLKTAAARFVKVRIRNTSAVTPFSNHYTGVEGR